MAPGTTETDYYLGNIKGESANVDS
jgi:hypothetical protein